MKFFLLHLCTLLSIALVESHAVTPDVYWKSVLPNSPMPKSIKYLLSTEWMPNDFTQQKEACEIYKNYRKAASENQLKDNEDVATFLLEGDLHQGTEMILHYTKNDDKSMFLPRKIVDSIPFSSKDLPQIYQEFSVKPDSMGAKIMKQTLEQCEDLGIEGEEKYCATSLESMIDFSTSKLGKNVKAISTEVNTKKSSPLQKYKIEVAKKLAANNVVVCHKQNYVHAVFYCHKIIGTEMYTVSMIGADGTKVNTVAVCHTNTTKWNPKHISFQVLKMKPGTAPVCHVLHENAVVWVPY